MKSYHRATLKNKLFYWCRLIHLVFRWGLSRSRASPFYLSLALALSHSRASRFRFEFFHVKTSRFLFFNKKTRLEIASGPHSITNCRVKPVKINWTKTRHMYNTRCSILPGIYRGKTIKKMPAFQKNDCMYIDFILTFTVRI